MLHCIDNKELGATIMQMQVQDVVNAIKVSNFTNDDFVAIVNAVQNARAQTGRNTIRELKVGDTVTFTGRRSKTVTGTVVKIKIKNVVVSDNSTQTRWNVPASMLTVVSS